ncbi:ComEC/Rec2 family competence protein [Aurantimicrobium minutum]|uniref:ComEC/Rec2 family competence protein n=1 Tax=Aurantimicrobium minutum TaxID=708131 RepID=UPI0024764A56|nr:ComEC/Rec2 family competence protein [Aurantimicrobium minutum]
MVVLAFFGGLLTFRHIPHLSLSLLSIGAVCISLLIQLPFHPHVSPWQENVASTSGTPDWAAQLRQKFVLASQEMPGVGGQLIPGLGIGDTTTVSQSLSDAMKMVSLTHITAVSGANCIIVTAGVSMIAGMCGAGRRIRIILGLLALVIFVVIVTPQPSVMRASVMAVLVLIGMYIGRPGTGVALLSTAVLILLLWNPWWALEYGFILSVLAVFGLLVFSQPLGRSLSKWMPSLLAELISIPLAAQLMCQPVIILLAPAIPVYGLLANILATPAAPVATVCGLLAFLSLPFFPVISQLLLWCAWIPAQWIGSTAEFLAALPAAAIPWMSGPLGLVCAAAGSALMFLVLIARTAFVRRLSTLVLVLCFGCVVVFSGISGIPRGNIPQDWSIAACDVGQGDALIVKSANAIAAIDVGRRPAQMQKCLSTLGITHLDLLVLTHFDKDHVGGLSAVTGKVDHVISGGPENSEDEGLLRDLRSHGATVERGRKGMSGTLGSAQWNILWPQPGQTEMQQGNPGSVTVEVVFPEFNALFLGDLGEESQRALLEANPVGQVDVVKVAHHGSADQYPQLYERLRPSISLLSVGAENDYGHPRKEILELLEKLDSKVPRTDHDGLIVISPAPGGLSIWTEH